MGELGRPTAVMAVNDLTAVGVIKGLLKEGLRVPQDISVTGFDNTRLAEYSNPSITTVDVHRDMLGQMAADALHELSASPNPQGREYQIPAELMAMDNVVLLPHVGSATRETRQAMGDLCKANLDAYFSGRGVLTLIPELA